MCIASNLHFCVRLSLSLTPLRVFYACVSANIGEMSKYHTKRNLLNDRTLALVEQKKIYVLVYSK